MATRVQAWMMTPLVVALVAAVGLLAAFPPLEWGWLAWIAMGPALYVLRNGLGGVTAWLVAGWGFGILFYAVQYAWLPRTLLELGGVGVLRFVGISTLGLLFLAVWPALMLGGARWAWLRWGVSPYLSVPVFFAIHDAALGGLPFGGLPWGSLAGTQTTTLVAAVLAPLAGGAAVVWMVVAVNAGWGWVGESMALPARSGWGRAVVLGVLTLALSFPWAIARTSSVERESFSMVLVPGNYPVGQHGEQWIQPRIRQYLARTLRALEEFAGGRAGETMSRLVVWPEAALAGTVRRMEELNVISEIAPVMNADFLVGADFSTEDGETNAAFLIEGNGNAISRYDKQRLVPFGEYIPSGFRWLIGKKVARGERDYLPGRGVPVVPWRGRKLGVAICSESLVADHFREAVLAGAELIVVMANDQWLTVPARTQHLRLTALRGLAVGREVVFAANGGWNAHLRDGRAVNAARWDQPPLQVRPTPRRGQTPWVRWGYFPLGLLLAAWCGGGLALRRWDAS